MSAQSPANTPSRPVGGTEHSWCRAVPGGTGITVLALLFSKPPDPHHLQTCIHKLQTSHPILRSKLRFNPSANSFSILTPSGDSDLQIRSPDPSQFPQFPQFVDSFYRTVEHELNTNPWRSFNDQERSIDVDVMFVSLYTLPEERWAVVLRLHTAVCDRAAAAFLVREFVGLYGGGDGELVKGGLGLGLPIEDCVPAGKANKPFWARGADMLGYSVNSFRFSNLGFREIGVPNSTQFVRLKIGLDETDRILSACKSKGIKLFGLLAAAGFLAAHASKNFPDEKWEKYSLATLIDCRSHLDPVLSDHHIGFYHSVITNSHDIKGGEDVWHLAQRICTSFQTAKNNNKHFTDMSDLNFLMCKAIENPSVTPSSSLRTSLISVFEEPLIESTDRFHQETGLLDCIGCASVHSVGPSLAIFDAIRDGELDCACVYPSPSHSREQMQDYVGHMKKIILESIGPE